MLKSKGTRLYSITAVSAAHFTLMACFKHYILVSTETAQWIGLIWLNYWTCMGNDENKNVI